MENNTLDVILKIGSSRLNMVALAQLKFPYFM